MSQGRRRARCFCPRPTSEVGVVQGTLPGPVFSSRNACHHGQNEAEVCDVLCGALAGMLKDREGPCSTQASSNGPMREPQVASAAALEGRDAGEDQEEEVTRVVLPEDRKKAVELLRMGEERVLRKCLEWVEVRCKALSHLFLSGRCSLNDDPILVPDPSYFAR